MKKVQNCGICSLFDQIEPFIETEHWVGYVRTNQSYLGQSDFLLKRHAGDLASLTDKELLDFKNLVSDVQTAIRSAFSADVFNWTCLMNNAYQKNPAQPHVHWHLKPRYAEPITLKGLTFTDDEYGYHYDESKELIVNDSAIRYIQQQIEKALPS